MIKRLLALLLCMVMFLGIDAMAEGEWRNILLLGNDTRSFPKFERSDVMMIISINENKGKVKLTSIMRDTDVSYAGGGGGKINGAMATGGPEKTVATVNKNFGTDISEYIVIDFKQMMQAIDLIGGVSIVIDEGERNYLNEPHEDFAIATVIIPGPIEVVGLVHLNSYQALHYCRNRSSSPAGDYDRVKRHRRMLIALLNELQEKPVDEVLDLADDLIDLVSTNMTDEQLLELGKFALTVDTATIDEFRLPADGAFQDGTFNGVWKIKPNLEKNRRLLQEFINGAELKKGSAGESVRKLQQKLTDMGVLEDKVDGVFGSKTEAAVKVAQAQLGFEQTGKADEDFLDALYAQ